MTSIRVQYQEDADIFFSKPFTIDELIEKLRSYDDKWAWVVFISAFCHKVDSRNFFEFMVTISFTGSGMPSQQHIDTTRIDLIKEFIDKIKNQDNIQLLSYSIAGIATVRYYVMDDYIQLKHHYNELIERNCFTNLFKARI